MTVKNLIKACKENKYILLRHELGFVLGVNCKAPFIDKRPIINENRETQYIGFIPCSFMEYISNKNPFVKSK